MTLSSRLADPPGQGDHLRPQTPGATVAVVVYTDFECPRCALAYERLTGRNLLVGLRHFPIASRHPRARAAAEAVEAAGLQGAFWNFADRLLLDQGRLDDPYLWQHAEELGLNVEKFDADRRSSEVRNAVDAAFQLAIRAGVAASPTLLVGTELHQGVPVEQQLATWESSKTA